MKINVTVSQRGSEDGQTNQLYEAGQTYEMGEPLGRVFLREGWGTEAVETTEAPPIEEAPPVEESNPAPAASKALSGPPKTKAATGPTGTP